MADQHDGGYYVAVPLEEDVAASVATVESMVRVGGHAATVTSTVVLTRAECREAVDRMIETSERLIEEED